MGFERVERPWREAERRFFSGGRARRRLLALRLDNHARTSGGDVAREDVSARRRKSTRRLGVIDMATAWRQTQREFVVGIRAQGRLSTNGLDIGEGWGSETMKSDDFDYYVYEFIQRSD